MHMLLLVHVLLLKSPGTHAHHMLIGAIWISFQTCLVSNIYNLCSMELVNFTDDTYQSLSNDTITTSSSDKGMVCIKRKCTNCSTRKAFLEKVVVELVLRSPTRESESIAKVQFKYFLVHKHINIYIYMYNRKNIY